MPDQYSRTRLLLGSEGVDRLRSAHVALFGLGGVGGYAAEALARAGIGHIDLIDNDTVSMTNLNRQMLALHSTIGEYKVDVAQKRIYDIDPTIVVRTYKTFYLPETQEQFDFSQYDYIVDAIDTVTGKLCLAERAFAAGTPIISCMGAGNKLDGTAFQVADISKTTICPLARVMRKELKKRGINHMKVVFTTEEALTPVGAEAEAAAIGKRQIPGSTSYIPGIAGLLLAGEVIKDLAMR